MKKKNKSQNESSEVEKLRAHLEEAEEALRAIRSGEVDALVVSTQQGEQVFTLKGAEQPYRILIEEMSEGAAMLAADDSILYCNSSFAGMLKTPLEKLMGTAIEHYIAPSNESAFWELLRQGREKSSSGEIILLTGDGTFVPAQLSFNTLQMDEAPLVYLVATDLTGQKQIQDELQRARDELEIRVDERTAELAKSEQRWATTLASIGDAVISTDVEGRITFMNAEAEALTGWTLAEASTKPITEVFNIINGNTRLEADNPVCRVIKEGRIIGLANHTLLVRKDGTEVPIDDSGAPIRDADGMTMGVVLVFRDITERKRAEEALRESEGRLKSILDNSSTVVFLKDLEGRYITVNRRFEELFHVTRQDVVGKSDHDIFPREHADRFRQHDLLALEKGGPIEVEEFVPHDDGVHVYISVKFPLFTAGEKPYAVCGIATDITERKRSEEALRQAHDYLEQRVRERTAELIVANKTIHAWSSELEKTNKALLESEASYRELAESIDDLFYAMDSDLRYTYWNKASEALTGIPAKDAVGKSIYELFPDIKGTKAEQSYIEALKTQQPLRFETLFEIRRNKFIFEVNVYPTENGISVISKDITEKKKLEAQLLRAQRMESIGTLAGGIAHDLNNMLTPMMMSLHTLKEKLNDDESRKLVNILENNSRRGADLIKQVLSFSRGVEGERVPLAAKHIIYEIEKIAKETFPRNIEIRTDIQKDLFNISGDSTQIHQVIMNLCVNARDAMEDGGVLGITALNFFVDKNYVRMHSDAKVGSYVVIAVSDTGTGIPPDIQDRIFEPFFTTKEFGKGTGLGLPTALAIVKSHGGFINVYSEAGKGTTFRVYLPAIKTEIQEPEKAETEMLAGHGELVLIVEDEDSIREITVSTLEAYGYKVLTASDGAEAVALYAQNMEKINVILMDMMMPVMDGHVSIRAIRNISPGVKIIAVSGLAEKDKLAKIEATRVHAFLPKPYTADKLLKTIHETLSAK